MIGPGTVGSQHLLQRSGGQRSCHLLGLGLFLRSGEHILKEILLLCFPLSQGAIQQCPAAHPGKSIVHLLRIIHAMIHAVVHQSGLRFLILCASLAVHIDALEELLGFDLLVAVPGGHHGLDHLVLLGLMFRGQALDGLIFFSGLFPKAMGPFCLAEKVFDLRPKIALHRRGSGVQRTDGHGSPARAGGDTQIRLVLQPLIGVDVEAGDIGVDAALGLLRHMG